MLEDIVKYADPKHDRIKLENYFYSALNCVCNAEKEEGFRKGIKIALELLDQPTFNEFTADAEYKSLVGIYKSKGGVALE